MTSVHRLPDGRLRLTGLDLDGGGGAQVLELDPRGRARARHRREGDHVRLASPTPEGAWLLVVA